MIKVLLSYITYSMILTIIKKFFQEQSLTVTLLEVDIVTILCKGKARAHAVAARSCRHSLLSHWPLSLW